MTTTDEVHLKTLMMLGQICCQEQKKQAALTLRGSCVIHQQIIQSPTWGKLVESSINKVREHPDVYLSHGWGARNSLPCSETVSLSWWQRGESWER